MRARRAPGKYAFPVDELAEARRRGLQRKVDAFDIVLSELHVQINEVERGNAEINAAILRAKLRLHE